MFEAEYIVDVNGTSNRELFASDNTAIIENLVDNIAKLDDPQLKSMMQQTLSNTVAYQKGDYILTDDKAPVELLGMRVIDELISDEVSYYKNIYEEKGIKGLIDLL